ncbi:MAG: O-antigen ligase family protein [Pseudomonadota bacterium]
MIAGIGRYLPYGFIGSFGGLLTIAVGSVLTPVAAIALAVAALLGLATVVYPFLGLSLLAVFSQLDGLSNVIFALSPISGFKLLTGTTLIGVLLLVSVMRDRFVLTLRDPVFIMACLFFAIMFVSALFATNKGYALDSIRRMFSLLLLLILFVLMIDRRSRLSFVIYILMGASLFSAIILCFDIAFGTTLLTSSDAATTARTAEGFDRSSGASEHNPTTAATMLLTGVIIGVVAFLEGGKHKRFYLAVIGIGTLGILLSFARSSALVYGVIVLLLMWRYRKSRYLPLGIFAGLMGLVAMLPFIPESYWGRIVSIFGGSGGDWTLGRRLTYNIIGVELALRYPILGVGPGNFKDWFTDPEFRYLPGRTLLGRQLHNMYLSVIVEYGIVGAFFFFGFLFHALRSVRRAMLTPVDDDMRVLATAYFYGFIAYLLVSVFVPNEYNKYTWMMAGIGSAFAYLNPPKTAAESTGTLGDKMRAMLRAQP